MSFHHFLDSIVSDDVSHHFYCLCKCNVISPLWLLLRFFWLDLVLCTCVCFAILCTQMWSLLHLFCLEFTELLGPVSWCFPTILRQFQALLLQIFLLPHSLPFLSSGPQKYLTLDWYCPTGLKSLLFFFSVLQFDNCTGCLPLFFPLLVQFTVKPIQWTFKFRHYVFHFRF